MESIFWGKKDDIFFQISISQSMLHHFMVKTEGEQKQQRNRLFAQKAYNNVFYYSELCPAQTFLSWWEFLKTVQKLIPSTKQYMYIKVRIYTCRPLRVRDIGALYSGSCLGHNIILSGHKLSHVLNPSDSTSNALYLHAVTRRIKAPLG